LVELLKVELISNSTQRREPFLPVWRAYRQMKARILIGVLILAVVFLIYQVYHFVEVAQQASAPPVPGSRFAVSPYAPTPEEVEREEKRLEQLNNEARAKATKAR